MSEHICFYYKSRKSEQIPTKNLVNVRVVILWSQGTCLAVYKTQICEFATNRQDTWRNPGHLTRASVVCFRICTSSKNLVASQKSDFVCSVSLWSHETMLEIIQISVWHLVVAKSAPGTHHINHPQDLLGCRSNHLLVGVYWYVHILLFCICSAYGICGSFSQSRSNINNWFTVCLHISC